MVVKDVLDLFGSVDGERILEKYLNYKKIDIFLNSKKEIEKEIEEKILKDYKLYENGMPLQYIIGKWNFYGRDFYVGENVLIPRYETEILIENILKISNHEKISKILEIGIGTGIISITLGSEIKNTEILGVDISDEALKLANKNRELHNMDNIKFIKSDLYEKVEGKFDLIVSNPPYINREDMKKLDKKLSYEPELALFGGEDGLDFYRDIIKDSNRYLNKGGYIAFEIGYDQRESIIDLLEKNNFTEIKAIKDYNGFDRCIIGKSSI